MRHTLKETRALVKQFVDSGSCRDEVIDARINEALERLMDLGDWECLRRVMRLTVFERSFCLPPNVETILWVDTDGKPGKLFGRPYQFLSSGPGDLDYRGPRPFKDVMDLGDHWVVMRELPKGVGDLPLLLVCEDEADLEVEVQVAGRTGKHKPVSTTLQPVHLNRYNPVAFQGLPWQGSWSGESSPGGLVRGSFYEYHYGDPNIVESPESWFTVSPDGRLTKFHWEEGREHVVIPRSVGGVEVKSIGPHAFMGVMAGVPVESLTAAYSLEALGAAALPLMGSLELLSLPGVTSIGATGLGPLHLTELHLPNVRELAAGAIQDGSRACDVYLYADQITLEPTSIEGARTVYIVNPEAELTYEGPNFVRLPAGQSHEGLLPPRTASPEVPLTAVKFSHVDIFTKPVTRGPLALLAVDEANGVYYKLAEYLPEDTRPQFRRYQLTKWACDAQLCTPVDVLALVRLRFTKLVDPEDELPIDSMQALKLMVMAIREENAGNLQTAVDYTAHARSILSNREKSRTVADGMPTVLNVDYRISLGRALNPGRFAP